MTAYGDAFSAIRSRLLAIGLLAILTGVTAAVIAYLTTPRIDVLGFVEVARHFHVDADGNVKEELGVPAVVLAGQINSGAFFEEAAAATDGKPAQLRRARFIARVPPRTENVEISVRVDAASEGIQEMTELVKRMAAMHRVQQQQTLDRLEKRQASIRADLDELQRTRRQLEATVAELAKSGGTREGVQNFIVVSLRSQLNKDIRELERMRQSLVDAISLTRDRPTRLIGNVIPVRASLLPCIAVGLVVGMLAGLLAAAVVVARAYRRGATGHD